MVSHMHRRERVQGLTNKYSFVPDKQPLIFAPLMPRQVYEDRVSLQKKSDQKKNIEKESEQVTIEKESEQKKTSGKENNQKKEGEKEIENERETEKKDKEKEKKTLHSNTSMLSFLFLSLIDKFIFNSCR